MPVYPGALRVADHPFGTFGLVGKAATLFERQPAHEKRKLLRFVVEGCKWKDGALSYRYKQPFENLGRPSAQVLPLAA
jgi:hypothetical protein